jgi:hypothetical protein
VTLVANVAYDAFGPELTADYDPAGLDLSRDYDLAGRLTDLAVKDGATALHQLGLGHDDAGRLTARDDAVTPANDETFAYSVTDRLTGATGAYPALAFAYDAVGNRVSRTQGTAVETYAQSGGGNQITARAGIWVWNDDGGRMTQRFIDGEKWG